MSSLWISKKKKTELVTLCEQLGLEADGYLKSDLESILTEYLDAHGEDLSSDPVFAPYYDTTATRSPTKVTHNALADLPEKRTRRRTSRYVVGTSSFDNASTGEESTPEPGVDRKTRSGSRALATRTPRTVRSLRQAAEIPLPPSPAVVAAEIESRANALVASAKKTIEKAEIPQKATSLRDRLSNVISVNAITLSLEAALLLHSVIPQSFVVTIPAYPALGNPEKTYLLPDLFALLTVQFWAPFLTWFFTSFALPLANSALFNLVATTVKAKDAGEYNSDPLTFAVTKALIAYLVHYKSFTFWGLVGGPAVSTVANSVGRELQLVGAGIGGIAAIWEAILRARS